jgi:hypothetical protein
MFETNVAPCFGGFVPNPREEAGPPSSHSIPLHYLQGASIEGFAAKNKAERATSVNARLYIFKQI